MSLNDITIVRGQGGLGRALDGEDYYSGFLFYADTLPSGFTAGQSKQVLSPAQAESLGILADYSDETRATGVVTISNAGATNDTIEIKIAEPKATVSLGKYTRTSAASTVTLVAADIVAMINAGTRTHGYTAANTSGAITITARKGLGVFLNSGTPISTVIVGTIARSLTQFSGGVASKLAIWHYHISEYFRIQPSGNLRVMFATLTANTYNFAELGTMQSQASGKLRQVGIYLANTGSFTYSAITTACQSVQAKCDTLEGLHQPLSTLVAVDLKGTSDLTTLTDLGALNCRSVSVVISQDGANLGNDIFKASGYSITDLGAKLGAVSLAPVNEDIAWVQKYNMTNGVELSVPAYANGVSVDMVNDQTLLTQLNLYRYLFLRTFTGNAGVFNNDNHCAIAESSDYAYMNDNRVIDKAHRNLYAGILPYLNGTVTLNADGTIADFVVEYLKSLGGTSLDQMVRDGEISAYEILIDPSQDVLGTSKIVVTANIVPTGVARHIQINLGFVTSI
jgi:hypothetical protein